MRFAHPILLLLLLFALLPWLKLRREGQVPWPSLTGFGSSTRRPALFLAGVIPTLQTVAICGIAIALARPQEVAGRVIVSSEGVAIVTAIDRSSTMRQADFPAPSGVISREKAAREVLVGFIRDRPRDLIGLVSFALFPDTNSPPTLDHEYVIDAALDLGEARSMEDGSNLGDAIVWSIEELRATPAERKVLILISDGRQEAPRGPLLEEPVDPKAAAMLARDLGIVIHTIAIGRPPDQDVGLGSGPDYGLMSEIARIGGGKAVVAADRPSLASVMAELDRLIPSSLEGEVRTRYRERYVPFAATALAALFASQLVRCTRADRIP